jgi:hypothetical protein
MITECSRAIAVGCKFANSCGPATGVPIKSRLVLSHSNVRVTSQ